MEVISVFLMTVLTVNSGQNCSEVDCVYSTYTFPHMLKVHAQKVRSAFCFLGFPPELPFYELNKLFLKKISKFPNQK